jgi:hypothetical protein
MRDGQSQVCETIAPRSAVPRAAVESPGGRIRMSGIGALHRASRAGLLGRKAALARLLRETEAGILLKRTPRTALPSSCLPARCRGYRFEEGRWHVSIWPVSCLDQSPQSRQHRGAVGAQRELESASLRQCAPTMTRHAITPRSSTALSVDLKGCAARLQQVGPTSA